jgi:hypothetical protein
MTTSRTFLVIAAVATLAGFACQEADATPIVGLLNISGSGPSPDGSSLSNALFDVAVGGGTNTGAFFTSIQNGTTIVMTSPFLFPGSIVLWSVDGFTMELGPLGEPMFQPHQMTLNGTAILFAPGSKAFGGQWTMTSGTSGEFHFVLTSSTLVTPDSGMTVALFGLGVVAIAVCRAKLATS